MRNEKRERYAVKEKARLVKMLEDAAKDKAEGKGNDQMEVVDAKGEEFKC